MISTDRSRRSRNESATAQMPLASAAANLGGWLESMRQPGGYGGPVAHWWQSSYVYTGPGLDWRYEGILHGYATLARRTRGQLYWDRMNAAVGDLLAGQNQDGSFRWSRFEMNPGTLGTPHEAAAALGLFAAREAGLDDSRVASAAVRALDNLSRRLWDGAGFNDRPGVAGRVPNKLATLAEALMRVGADRIDPRRLELARNALGTVLELQIPRGPHAGAIHQYAPGRSRGDGRLFPYYNARCVPALKLAHERFGETRYLDAAHAVLDFVDRVMDPDGSWPQIVYTSGTRARWPRWHAGVADILLAYRRLGRAEPAAAVERLLAAQLPSGGFATRNGFGFHRNRGARDAVPDYRDVTPVVGWNDKVLRYLAERIPPGTTLPPAETVEYERSARVGDRMSVFRETEKEIEIRVRGVGRIYYWRKTEPWAREVDPVMGAR